MTFGAKFKRNPDSYREQGFFAQYLFTRNKRTQSFANLAFVNVSLNKKRLCELCVKKTHKAYQPETNQTKFVILAGKTKTK